jgi:hypothetical protein
MSEVYLCYSTCWTRNSFDWEKKIIGTTYWATFSSIDVKHQVFNHHAVYACVSFLPLLPADQSARNYKSMPSEDILLPTFQVPVIGNNKKVDRRICKGGNDACDSCFEIFKCQLTDLEKYSAC